MQAPHHGALRGVVVSLTRGDFLLALADMNVDPVP
jgi:hypothetical protein